MPAVRQVSVQPQPVRVVYRGSMLQPEQYAPLYSALGDRGIKLINDPAADHPRRSSEREPRSARSEHSRPPRDVA